MQLFAEEVMVAEAIQAELLYLYCIILWPIFDIIRAVILYQPGLHLSRRPQDVNHFCNYVFSHKV